MRENVPGRGNSIRKGPVGDREPYISGTKSVLEAIPECKNVYEPALNSRAVTTSG